MRFADALVVVPGTWLVFDHFTHRVTLIGFARDAGERAAVERGSTPTSRACSISGRPSPARCAPTARSQHRWTRRRFSTRVAQAKEFIYEGDAYQLQVGIRFSCALAGTAFDFYRQIRARNPSPYMFFIEARRPRGVRCVAGVSRAARRAHRADSPARRDASARQPIRRPTSASPSELLADEKERAEHVMLVDLARNDLGAVCRTGSVRVDELMVIERYSHVMHIVSNVVGELRDDKDALDLFAAAFPAGTVTGTPKIRAMQLIDRLEPVARGFYAGSVAHIDFDGDMDSCIILRSRRGRGRPRVLAGVGGDRRRQRPAQPSTPRSSPRPASSAPCWGSTR